MILHYSSNDCNQLSQYLPGLREVGTCDSWGGESACNPPGASLFFSDSILNNRLSFPAILHE